jgi:branched-chain amino acid aminotransferase
MPASPIATAQLFALEPAGPRGLAVPDGAHSIHELFDTLPLGVYSALRTFQHERFLDLEGHLERTNRSMELLGWDFRLDRPALRRALHETVTRAPFEDSRVRFDVLRTSADALGTDARVLIALSPFAPIPEGILREGARVELTAALRRERPRIKTAEFVLRRRPYPLERQDAFEHIMVDPQGLLLEGTSSNFHAVRGGELWTAGEGVLEGITSRILVTLARSEGILVRAQKVSRDELGQLDEAFLSSSIRGVVPIVRIGETRIGGGEPGPITRRLIADYADAARREARPAVDPR